MVNHIKYKFVQLRRDNNMKNLLIMAIILVTIIATTATAAVVCYEMHRQNPLPTKEEQVAALRPLIPFAIAGQLD